jgi:hypothetical protein
MEIVIFLLVVLIICIGAKPIQRSKYELGQQESFFSGQNHDGMLGQQSDIEFSNFSHTEQEKI